MRSVISFVSFDSRLAPFERGMLNTRDVLYFLSIITLGLFATNRAIEAHRWS